MTREEALDRIAVEFRAAASAGRVGHEGKVRVCARRAAGIAITYWLQSNSREGWGVDALNQLRAVEREDDAPQAVREAARRLTTKVTERFTSPFPTDPLDDSRQIIDFFLQE